MCASIWLKFGTRIGGLNANSSIKYGINLINIRGVTSNFTHLTKSNFCQAYRLNCFEEQAENRCVARLNIRGINCVRDKRDMKLNPTLVKLRDRFCVNKKNQEFPPISHKQQGGTS